MPSDQLPAFPPAADPLQFRVLEKIIVPVRRRRQFDRERALLPRLSPEERSVGLVKINACRPASVGRLRPRSLCPNCDEHYQQAGEATDEIP